MSENERFVPIGEAAIRLGCSRTTVGRLIERGVLPAYETYADGRMRLVDVNDLAKIAAPRPIARETQPTASASAA